MADRAPGLREREDKSSKLGDLNDYNTWDSINSKDKITKSEFAQRWIDRWTSADRVYRAWAQRFKVDVLYQYYEGFQHLIENDENNRAYVVNLIYSIIEGKLPNLLFDNPTFVVRPHPYGLEFDEMEAAKTAQVKEDVLNYITGREALGFNDKHELAILDAFFGFGVLETDYSKERLYNPLLDAAADDPLDNLYVKQIPFDTFRVSATANWDLSMGKWWGYYEYLPYSMLVKYIKSGQIKRPNYDQGDQDADFAELPTIDGQVVVGETSQTMPPAGCIKVLKIEDFQTGKLITICPDNAEGGDRVLEVEDFDTTRFSILRFGKRRRGWYPLPPVYQWLSPQDEINDVRQTQAIHRKRFTRKYAVSENRIEQDELDKLLYGPDGTIIKVKGNVADAIEPIKDATLDPAAGQSLQVSYADLDRVSGAISNLTPAPDRETATASAVTAQRAQVRESKEVTRVGNFMVSFARNMLRCLRKCPASFWVPTKIPEGLGTELRDNNTKWQKISNKLFKKEDYDIDLQLSSISPVYQQEDKKAFLEFLALLSQYEILSISPDLLREAAYRVGYKNSRVLNEFQQLAQLAMIGKIAQAKQQTQQILSNGQGAPQGPQPGQLPQAQVASSTPSSLENIRNMIFGLQGAEGQGGGVQK